MNLLALKQLTLSYGQNKLLDDVHLVVEQGQRIGIMGRNGAGKSTLLKLIAGLIQPDAGERSINQGCRLAYLPQEVPSNDTTGTVFELVAEGFREVTEKLDEYHALNNELSTNTHDQQLLNRITKLQTEIESADGWSLEQRINTQLSKFRLEGSQPFNQLSGGMKRRALLARAMLCEPNLILLDEPTNHLDIASIEGLEQFLLSYSGTTMIISHDRSFLEKVTNHTIEIDRGQIYSYPQGYSKYFELKEARLEEEAKQQALFDKKLAQEEAWIRQGIKARRTRNQGRVRALEAMRLEKGAQRPVVGEAKISHQVSEQSGKQVVVAKNVSFHFEGQTEPALSQFSISIARGDKVAIIGPSGYGKSTLLKLLLGELTPTSGTIKIGTHCQIAYFDQLRIRLDPEKSLRDNVGGGSDRVTINGKEKHVIGYLQDFLFTPDRIHSPVSVLSGGEKNRLLLAKLFTQPSNLLVLDEPTNDLDIETLELLEELLNEYTGTLLLVSHDREFIDRIATQTLVFEQPGRFSSYIGGYNDWIRQRAKGFSWKTEETLSAPKNASDKKERATSQKSATTTDNENRSERPREKKLSYKEKRELESLPQEIEMTEAALEKLQSELADPQFYQNHSSDKIAAATQNLEQLQKTLTHLYERWELLE